MVYLSGLLGSFKEAYPTNGMVQVSAIYGESAWELALLVVVGRVCTKYVWTTTYLHISRPVIGSLKGSWAVSANNPSYKIDMTVWLATVRLFSRPRFPLHVNVYIWCHICYPRSPRLVICVGWALACRNRDTPSRLADDHIQADGWQLECRDASGRSPVLVEVR